MHNILKQTHKRFNREYYGPAATYMKKVYTYRCDPELIEASKQLAQSKSHSLSSLIRLLLAAAIDGKIKIEDESSDEFDRTL